MTIETETDLEGLRRIGQIVSRVLRAMLEAMEPGMTTAELNTIGAKLLDAAGARSAPQLAYDFPAATCISVNEEIAHGIPGSRIIVPGDLVNVDVSAELDGYFADTGGSRAVPPVSSVAKRLCHATELALERAMQVATDGVAINRIGKAVEQVASAHRFRVIRNLGGHGVGRALHEEPGFIGGHFDPSDKRRLREGMVITIEPFLSTKTTLAAQADDGWTLLGVSGARSAQYEHTLVITRGAPIVVTAHGPVALSLLVNVDVDDLNKGIEFYTKALGLKTGRRFGADAVELLGASSTIFLLAKPNGTVASSTSRHLRSYARHWTPVHLDFVVDSIESALDQARNAGARLEGQVRTNSWGKIAMLADPFGHGICLIEFLGRGYDEIADKQHK